jgi:hypothetical protein
VDLAPSDGHFHVGQRVPIWYDATNVCGDVLFGDSDWRSSLIGDIVGNLLPLVLIPILWWHAGRWRDKAEEAASAKAASGWSVRRVHSWTRRPLFMVSSESGAEDDLYLPVLNQQLVNLVEDPSKLEVLGQPQRGATVALHEPGSDKIIWPSGNLRIGQLTLDRYNFSWLAALMGPALMLLVFHLTAGPHSC